MNAKVKKLLINQPLPQKAGFLQRWLHSQEAASALALVEAAQKHPAPLLVVCPNSQSALNLLAELEFFAPPELEILSFPDWGILPYDRFSPHENLVAQRLQTLLRLPSQRQGILVVPINTLMQRLPPQEFVASQALSFHAGQKLSLHEFRQQLEQAGYLNVANVYAQGEFAVRGGLLDLFPLGSPQPLRLEFFDDEIDSLRYFDPETQRSAEQAEAISLLPAHEFVLNADSLEKFRTEFQTKFNLDLSHCQLYQDTLKGIVTPGLEFFLPLFFSHTISLFDYLPAASLVVAVNQENLDIDTVANSYWQEINRRYESLRHDIRHPCLPPTDIYLPLDKLHQERNLFAQIEIHASTSNKSLAGDVTLAAASLPNLAVKSKAAQPLNALENFLTSNPETRILFGVDSAGRRAALLEVLHRYGFFPQEVSSWQEFVQNSVSSTKAAVKSGAAESNAAESNAKGAHLSICLAPLDRGLYLPEAKILLVTEALLFGEKIRQRQERHTSAVNQELAFKSLSELSLDAPVVHLDHGIGRYKGLETLSTGGVTQEFLKLVYADNTSLYVPVAHLDKISRYSGGQDDKAPLHKLGSDTWEKSKRKAAEKVHDTAAELLDIYAKRAAKQGFSFQLDAEAWFSFSQGFPFEETLDQQQAIDAVIQDMQASQPMDRVVCGDVGFGKTEVAMRAAFLAAHNNKQVAILVPTTLLAQQHFENFQDRFADWPFNIELLSRFRSAKEQATTLERLETGQVDIVIGTHKLLQKNIKFKDLGLVIVDEEHRFGVRQKESLKALSTHVDLLSMTATPIPRTLNMAMGGMRDLSIIATAPAKRLATKTFVRAKDAGLIKEAIQRELLRGGQVYFLHNDVSSIENAAAELNNLIPELRLGIAHGQMPERQLERVMQDFYHKRYNLLLCSTIIETGIDIPSANTIIIDRADKFGLAQLHQLRGRVGRSHHQAYAYLLTPEGKKLSKDAQKRLDAIALHDDLGAGFLLASQDLEIRGAGELLGSEQSGQISSLGFSLYMELLEEAVAALREGRTPDVDLSAKQGVEINLYVPALIPDDYLADVNSRLQLYKRIASCGTNAALRDLQVEMIDRFGLLPPACKNLFALSQLKLRCQHLGIKRLDASASQGLIGFAAQTRIEPIKLVQLVQQQAQIYKLDSSQTLKFNLDMSSAEKCFAVLNQVLDELSSS